MKRNSNNIL